MTSEACSAYPHEAELLLMDGCQVYILSVQKNVIVKNNSGDFSKYNGKKLTIVHMFHE